MTAATLVTLRIGQGAWPLFVFSGSGGRADELAGLAAALAGPRPVVAVTPNAQVAPETVEVMADQAAAAIRARQAVGPYHLLGYSFGGLVALETARRLRAQGEAVGLVGLMDTIFDWRFWPRPLFLKASARRAGGHLARLARRPLGQAIPELAVRARRLAARVTGRGRLQAATNAADPVEALCLAAMGRYEPRPYDGPVVFFGAAGASDFGCDPAELWAPLCPELEVRKVAGAHLDLVREPASLAALAETVEDALGAAEGQRPMRVLLAASFNWIATSRLALGLVEAGFVVEAVCPRGHSLRRLGLAQALHAFDPLRPEHSLVRAVRAARPDLILACDDRATQALHAAHDGADPQSAAGARVRARLARSLGPAEAYDWLYSRAAVMVIAEEEGVRRPATARVRSAADVEAWMAANPGGAVLKTDGSWGGREVMFVDDAAQAARAFRRLQAPPNPLRALKRLLVDGDAVPIKAVLTRRTPAVSVQAFVSGTAGNSAVSCLDGRVLAAVHVEVVRSDGAVGPATVVRVIDHAEMARAARAMVRRMKLTGLVGFDFILEADGAAHLIELNPRATPTAHLTGADGSDLLAALAAALRRRDAARGARPAYAGGLVALFPQEMRRDPASVYLRSAHHDVPWRHPQLVELALAETNAPRAALNRLVRRLGGR